MQPLISQVRVVQIVHRDDQRQSDPPQLTRPFQQLLRCTVLEAEMQVYDVDLVRVRSQPRRLKYR